MLCVFSHDPVGIKREDIFVKSPEEQQGHGDSGKPCEPWASCFKHSY